MKTSKLISAVCFWLSSFGVYAQTEYFISAEGNDSNAGSVEAPCFSGKSVGRSPESIRRSNLIPTGRNLSVTENHRTDDGRRQPEQDVEYSFVSGRKSSDQRRTGIGFGLETLQERYHASPNNRSGPDGYAVSKWRNPAHGSLPEL